MVWHWNCASALCHNSWRTKGVRYYNLPVDPEFRRKYQLVLKNENVNWTKQVICSAHWSRGSLARGFPLTTFLMLYAPKNSKRNLNRR